MPGRDGRGPVGNGPIGSGGVGRRDGRGGGLGPGPSGECVCPQCGEIIPHRPGFPCTSVKCPKCQNLMIRK